MRTTKSGCLRMTLWKLRALFGFVMYKIFNVQGIICGTWFFSRHKLSVFDALSSSTWSSLCWDLSLLFSNSMWLWRKQTLCRFFSRNLDCRNENIMNGLVCIWQRNKLEISLNTDVLMSKWKSKNIRFKDSFAKLIEFRIFSPLPRVPKVFVFDVEVYEKWLELARILRTK